MTIAANWQYNLYQCGKCYDNGFNIFVIGTTCFLLGSVIRILESKSFCKFSTFLQLNFDELYDNAGNLQMPICEDMHFQDRTTVSLSQISADVGPAVIQGKDQFVEVDETPKPSKLLKTSSSDDCASSSADSTAKSQLGRWLDKLYFVFANFL